MAQPILRIHEPREGKGKTIANVLPARIHHDGPVDPVESFWTPIESEGRSDQRTVWRIE
jgi:ribonuclease H2 subunit C